MLNVYHFHTDPKSLLQNTNAKPSENISNSIPHDPMKYSDAVAYVKSLREGGFNDWRLPTLSEMQSLMAEACTPGKHFHHKLPFQEPYWTSNTDGKTASVVFPFDNEGADLADIESFFSWADIDDIAEYGNITIDGPGKSNMYNVLPVRGTLEPFIPISQRNEHEDDDDY